ncbi:MAG: hypothetical protein PHE67_10490 [Campylobacterales bacterium]|nr:hypothetical protein [Campylobacterales bacterium]
MKKFNLEVGRIRGWLKDPVHAAEELDMSVEEAKGYWNSSFALLPSNASVLLPNFNVQLDSEGVNVVNEVESAKNIPKALYDEDVMKTFQTGSLF